MNVQTPICAKMVIASTLKGLTLVNASMDLNLVLMENSALVLLRVSRFPYSIFGNQ